MITDDSHAKGDCGSAKLRSGTLPKVAAVDVWELFEGVLFDDAAGDETEFVDDMIGPEASIVGDEIAVDFLSDENFGVTSV